MQLKKAKKHANGYVHVIDNSLDSTEVFPLNAILGAWKVNEHGEIVGDFITNPDYINPKN